MRIRSAVPCGPLVVVVCAAVVGLMVPTSLSAAERMLLQFSSQHCGPCRQMEPIVQGLAQQGIPVRRIMVDESRDLARQFRIEGVPTFVVVESGREIAREVGAMNAAGLQAFCATHGLVAQTSSRDGGAMPPHTPQAAKTASSAGGFPEDVARRAMAASVRIRVNDPQGHSNGSGTIIDSLDGEALVLTCGHLFRDNQGRGQVSVDLFGDDAPRGLPGKVIGYDLRADVALVVIETPHRLPSMPVAGPNTVLEVGQPVVAIGCPRGADPQLQSTKIVSVNKYLGPANVQVAGRPVQGRSGGGLFSADGRVIGVCNAADTTADEGLYAALASIHATLKHADLMHLAGGGSTPDEQPAGPLAQAPTRREGPGHHQAQPRHEAPPEPWPGDADPRAAMHDDETPLARRLGPYRPGSTGQPDQEPPPRGPADVNLASRTQPQAVRSSDGRDLSARERAALSEIARRGEHAEVICIVRSLDDPRSQSEIIVLDRATPEFLEMLVSERGMQDGRQLTDFPAAPSSTPRAVHRASESDLDDDDSAWRPSPRR